MGTKDFSAWKIQRALALWDANRDAIATDALDQDEAELSGLIDNPADSDIRSIASKLARGIVIAEANEESCKFRKAELQQREVRWGHRAEKMRATLLDLMQFVGCTTEADMFFGGLHLPDVDVDFRKSPDGFVVTDEAKLPPEYKNIESVVTPIKKKINDDLKEGVVIDGVERTNGKVGIVVRTK